MASVRDSLSTASLFLEQYRSGFDFNGVGANILGAGSADRLAGRDMKLPLVKRAFDLLAFDETVGEARLPVRAGVVRGENLSAEVIQAHRLGAEIDEQRSVFGNIGGVGDLDPVLAHVKGDRSGCSGRGGCRRCRAFP